MFGISCWHLLRGRNIELFSRAAKLALIVAVPATLIQFRSETASARRSPPRRG